MKNTKQHQHTMKSILAWMTTRRHADGIGWHVVTAWLMPYARPQAGGLEAISRWLSEERATPPDLAMRPNASRRDASKLRWQGGMSWLPSLQDADVLLTLSGGVALLNHRLMAGNPSGSASAICLHSPAYYLSTVSRLRCRTFR